MAKNIVKCYGVELVEFTHWLVAVLNNITVKAQKRGKPNVSVCEGSSTYSPILMTSPKCGIKTNQLDDQPAFTDELFDNVVQNKLRIVLDVEGTSTTVEIDGIGSANANQRKVWSDTSVDTL